MANLVAALDSYTPKQIGENQHVEYGWSNDINEKIVQFFFQLVRCDDHSRLIAEHSKLLHTIQGNESQYKKQFVMLYKLIGQTRDILKGKGEQKLAFMQILNFYNNGYFNLVMSAIKNFVKIENEHPYGSWKDIKYLCEYVKSQTQDESHPIIIFCCSLIIDQLWTDHKNFNLIKENSNKNLPLSLAARWVPREKSKYGWINEIIARIMFNDIVRTEQFSKKKNSAITKAKIKLKQIFTPISKYLKTTQINQCSGDWSSIDFNTVTSATMRKQSRAFANKDKKNTTRSNSVDRIQCANNFKSHIEAAKSDPTNFKVKGRRCNVGDLARDACDVSRYEDTEIARINLQWEDNRKNNHGLENMIACCDTSGSMECDNKTPLVNAIGLSIRISELTNESFKNRILTFDENAQWIKLNECTNFVEKVKLVKNSRWGFSTNIYKMFDMILDVVVANEIPPENVENLILAIFSDMQINTAVNIDENSTMVDEYLNTLYDNVQKKFRDAGLRSKFRVPYQPPHILFWNLRSTSGFPVLSTVKNVSMLSGYSSVLMNAFCNKGMEAIKDFKPISLLEDLLNDKRFNVMDEAIEKFFKDI